jgi:hypothetical protein
MQAANAFKKDRFSLLKPDCCAAQWTLNPKGPRGSGMVQVQTERQLACFAVGVW